MIAPIVLVALLAASAFNLFQANGNIEKEYGGYLSEARSFAAKGIEVDATEYYLKAVELRNSFDLGLEISTHFKKSGKYDEALDFGYELLKSYPRKAEIYHFLMTLHFEEGDYMSCFKLSDTMQKRKLPMGSVLELLEEIDNCYFLTGQYDDVSVFGGGYCPVKVKSAWGYVNETGERAVKTRFTEAGPFRQGLAPVLDSESQAYFIDPDGNKKKTGTEKALRLGPIEDGVYTAFDGEKWGLYGNGDKLLLGGFDDISTFANSIAAAKAGGKWSILDSKGNPTSQATFDEVALDEKRVAYRSNRLFAKDNGFYYLMDKSGKAVSTSKFEDARLFNDTSYAAVKLGSKWGFIDIDGNFVIEPAYDGARSFSGGFAAVLIDGKWGFIDCKNKLAIPNIFDDAKDFNSHGCAFISFGDGWELLKLYKFNH